MKIILDMTEEEKIRELEKRIEKLENKNLGRTILVSALASAGGVSIFFSILPLIFFPDKLPGLGLLSFGIISLAIGLYFRQKWAIKGILDKN